MAIGHISDTARWVAMYRALESERPDAHFHDALARRLAGPEGEEILRGVPRGKAMAWPMVVRTVLFDDLLERLIRDEGADLVLNLAAGLDARPYRLELPPELAWVEVDLPGIIDYKEGVLAGETPRCRLERVRLDLTDRDARRRLFDRLGAGATRAVILTEGLLVYLPEAEVGALAADLHAPPACRWWIIDIVAPWLLARIKKMWGKSLAAGNAVMQFAPAAGTAFYEPFGWREEEFRPTMEEARRLHREMPLASVWRLIGRFRSAAKRAEGRRAAGVVLLERT
jgi:methyltransferase (TIGR00027 family)